MSTYRIHLHRPHANPWLLVVALAAALMGLASWVIVDQTSSETAPAAQSTRGLASAKVVAMLDERLSALNSGGKQSLVRYYSPAAVFEDFGVTPTLVTRGGAKVASLNETYSGIWAGMGWGITRESQVIEAGKYAAYALRLGDTPGITVFEFDQSGKIAHQWAIGGTQ